MGGLRSLFLAALAIGPMAFAGPLRAADKAEFPVGEEKLHWALPDHYCLPQGSAVTIAQMIASADHGNVTDLTAVSCAGDPYAKYLLLKTPAQLLPLRTGRGELIAAMGAEFDKPEFAELLKSGELDKTTADSLSSTFGVGTQTKSAISPMGRDELCAYMGGAVEIASGPASSKLGVIVCLTAVRGKVLSINAYEHYVDAGTVARLVPEVRAMAADLIAQNEDKN